MFDSVGQGLFSYNGKTILHFSTKDDLCNNRIRDIKEDKLGNILLTTLDGTSKFDAKKFKTLTVMVINECKLEPDYLWYKGKSNENGVYRYNGNTFEKFKP